MEQKNAGRECIIPWDDVPLNWGDFPFGCCHLWRYNDRIIQMQVSDFDSLLYDTWINHSDTVVSYR